MYQLNLGNKLFKDKPTKELFVLFQVHCGTLVVVYSVIGMLGNSPFTV